MNIRQKYHSNVEGAACEVTPDTALRQVADEHFKVRFRTFEIGSYNYNNMLICRKIPLQLKKGVLYRGFACILYTDNCK